MAHTHGYTCSEAPPPSDASGIRCSAGTKPAPLSQRPLVALLSIEGVCIFRHACFCFVKAAPPPAAPAPPVSASTHASDWGSAVQTLRYRGRPCGVTARHPRVRRVGSKFRQPLFARLWRRLQVTPTGGGPPFVGVAVGKTVPLRKSWQTWSMSTILKVKSQKGFSDLLVATKMGLERRCRTSSQAQATRAQRAW